MNRIIYLVCISMLAMSCASTANVDDIMSKDNQAEYVNVQAPYLEYNWTEEEASEYIIDKFTFGATDSLHEEIKRLGINGWLTAQLNPQIDYSFNTKLAEKYPALGMDVTRISENYPGLVVTLFAIGAKNRLNRDRDNTMRKDINFNEMFGTTLRNVQEVNRKWFYEMEGGEPLREPMQDLEFGNFMDLMYQLQAQKMLRALYSKHQLNEKLTDFWFNHFNVSLTRINDVATNILSYERDAIKPYVLGSFGDMLKATAQHPAMLTYLDNTNSEAPEQAKTLAPYKASNYRKSQKSVRNINENYARELLELHTLGVDGGYTQKDIEEVARILTGWKTSPLLYPAPTFLKTMIKQRIQSEEASFVEDGFFFNAGAHDAEPKVVMGKRYPSGRGVAEGYELLHQLATHPSTARFVSIKMATYFVNDDPDPDLVDNMAQQFLESQGNIKRVMKTMIESPEFWKKENYKAKAKSPFEFIASSLRAADAQVEDATEVLRWVNRMGQPLFSFQPPTGYPTASDFWINEAAIAQRIKFSYLLTSEGISGVKLPQNTSDTSLSQHFVSPEFQKK